MLCQHRPVTVCSSVNQGPHTYCPADFPISLSLVLLSGGASKVHKLTCPWFSHSCFRFPHHICDFHLHLSTAISTTTVLPLISNSRMKGYLFACLLTLFMVASAFAGPNQSKCIKEQATIVKATEKEATQGEVRVLLNRKGLPNELVDMVLAEAKRLPRPWAPIGEGIRHRKKTDIQLARACDTEVIKASGTDLHGPRQRRP